MHHWEWHDFTDRTESEVVDEFDPHASVSSTATGEYISRDFWVGSSGEGFRYTLGLLRITGQSLLDGITGGPILYHGRKLVVPGSGGWVVSFNLSGAGQEFRRVQLTQRARKDLFAAISCAAYDHYNVTKAGLYCWYAARPELVKLYDRALGCRKQPESRQKFIPGIVTLNQTGQVRRGYAIITRYY